MSIQEAIQPAAADHALDPCCWWILCVVVLAQFMFVVDVFIVNIAIPAIQLDLHASSGQIQLALAAYQLAYAVFLITGGRLGDIFGRKQLFLLGGFTTASALCGFAPTVSVLVGARVFQGAAYKVRRQAQSLVYSQPWGKSPGLLVWHSLASSSLTNSPPRLLPSQPASRAILRHSRSRSGILLLGSSAHVSSPSGFHARRVCASQSLLIRG